MLFVVATAAFYVPNSGIFDADGATRETQVSDECAEHIDTMLGTYAALDDAAAASGQTQPLLYPTPEQSDVLMTKNPDMYQLYQTRKNDIVLYELECREDPTSGKIHNYKADFLLIRNLTEVGSQRQQAGSPTHFFAEAVTTKCALNNFRAKNEGFDSFPSDIRSICAPF